MCDFDVYNIQHYFYIINGDAIESCSLFGLCHYFQLTDDEEKQISIKHDPVEDTECTSTLCEIHSAQRISSASL